MARAGYKVVYKITGYLRGGAPIYGYVEEKDPDYVAPTEKTTNSKEADAFTNLLKETAKTDSNESSSNQGSVDIDFGSQVDPVTPMTDAEKLTEYNAGIGQSKEKEDTSTNFDLDRFESLLSRLEASKGRQQRQKSVEGRRDIFSQGLASMMSNF